MFDPCVAARCSAETVSAVDDWVVVPAGDCGGCVEVDVWPLLGLAFDAAGAVPCSIGFWKGALLGFVAAAALPLVPAAVPALDVPAAPELPLELDAAAPPPEAPPAPPPPPPPWASAAEVSAKQASAAMRGLHVMDRLLVYGTIHFGMGGSETPCSAAATPQALTSARTVSLQPATLLFAARQCFSHSASSLTRSGTLRRSSF